MLVLMRDEGKITPQAYESAKAAPLGVVKSDKSNDLKGKYPAYVDAVINEAVHHVWIYGRAVANGRLAHYNRAGYYRAKRGYRSL